MMAATTAVKLADWKVGLRDTMKAGQMAVMLAVMLAHWKAESMVAVKAAKLAEKSADVTVGE